MFVFKIRHNLDNLEFYNRFSKIFKNYVPWLSLNTLRAGATSVAFHKRRVPSAEQDNKRWCAALYAKPQTASVCPSRGPLKTEGSTQNSKNAKSGGKKQVIIVLRFQRKQKHLIIV